MKTKESIQQKLAKFAHILGIRNSTYKPNLAQKSLGIKVHNALPVHSSIWKRNLDP
jgi:hypothetical protein